MTTAQLLEARSPAAPARSAVSRTRGVKRPKSGIRRARTFYMFVAPWVVGFVALTVFPLGYALRLSLTDSDGLSPRTHFVGLQNYAEIFKDPLTLSSLARTGVFALITVPLGIMAGLLLAV
ncbi:MAG TPA: sugar ABC transporter permease, partial [Kribbellaceae bacterium]